ncbi:GHKL domain-containing protein [Panacibacter ginsenosidivorans]|uniref:GHKL domain-containing protein n=2 Tax=Panacibacter ginsenosidivorans TaxID=1813871 RepID=A0A5B8VG64_9BACT|nr:GHKL domain-containing protein [Panacibacter ginsenosidivorans]
MWYVMHHQNQLQTPFNETNTPFNLYRNVIIPDISGGLMLYLVYLLLNLYTLPLIKSIREKKSYRYAGPVLQISISIIILGFVINIAEYYVRQWQFNYPEFSIFFDKNNPKSQMNIAGNFFVAAAIIVAYLLYQFIREYIISILERSKQKAYNISVCNKVTVFVFTIFAVHFFLTTFEFFQERDEFAKYIFVVSSMFAIFVSNVYWLFPLKGNDSFFSSRILIRLLSTSFVYAVPLTVLVHENGPLAMLYSWALQLFIVTPLTWIYFTYNKESILRLRTAEKELEQSKADLQFLRSQVNPHFLFNTLNTLYGTALQENAERTAEGIQMLGDMMRFMLHENNRDFINMQKETGYLKNYIALQKLRIATSNDIAITDNIETAQCNHMIAPMVLIPLVENAFKHGISLQERSWINIQLVCNETSIVFEVSNSVHVKQAADTEKDKSGIGLNNVRERLKHIYPGRFDFLITGKENEFTVKLSITP